jgi:hypothetical protein
MAGILDSYFAPSTFQGGTAGLLQNMPYYSVMPTMGAFPGSADPASPDEMSSARTSPFTTPPAQLNPGQSASPQPQSSLLNQILSGLGNNSNLLMAAGAGLASGGGIGGALQGAFQGRQLDVKNSTQQMQQLALYQAGKARGLSDAEAVTAALDPAGAGKLLFDRKVVPEFKPVTIGQNYGAFNPGSGSTAMQGAVPQAEKLGPGDSLVYATPPTSGSSVSSAPAPGAAGAGLPGSGNRLQMGGTFAPIAQGMSLEQKAEQEGVGKALADDYAGIQKNVQGAAQMKGTLTRMAQLSPDAYEGAGAPARQHVMSVLQTYFGVPESTLKSVKAGEEFTALANQAVQAGLGGKLGTGISNADVSFMKDQFPTLSQTAAGRRQIIDMLNTVADRQIETGKLADAYRKQNGSLNGFNVAMAQYADQHPIFGNMPAATPATPSAGAGGGFKVLGVR